MNANNEILLEQIIALLTQGNAHITFEKAVENVSLENMGIKPRDLPYSIWQLVEHIRIAQYDILDFCINPDYTNLNWPADYWPAEVSPTDVSAWQQSLVQIKNDRDQFINLLLQEGSDLYTPFEHGEGQNLLRESLLIADHTSYHTGQIVLIRRLLNDWNEQ